MSEVGSITAVLKLNASSFQTTLSRVSTDVDNFATSLKKLNSIDTVNGLKQFKEILISVLESLGKLNSSKSVVDLFHQLSISLKNTSTSFKSFIQMTRLSEIESKKLSEFTGTLKTNLVNLFTELQKVATGESELGKSFSDLINLATNLRSALDSVKTELTTIKNDFETLHGSVDKNKTSFNSMDKEVDESKNHFQQLNNQLKESNSKLSQIASTSKKTASSLGYLGGALRSSFSNIFNSVTSSISQAITETYKSKSEMNSWMDMLGFTTNQTNSFNSALDETVKKFQRVNKYQMGETIASIGVEFGLTEKEMEKALDVTSMITNEYLRAGRNSNEASLAVKDILQGQFQRLSRETGVKQEDLIEAGWSGDDKDTMGLLKALDKVAKSRNWDTIAMKASSINDIITIGQNKISVWSADLIDRFTPALTGAFNDGMLVLEEFMKIAGGVLDWLGGDGWGQTAVKIGSVVTAVMGLTNALIHYRTGASLLQISQMGLKDSILSMVLGLDAEQVAVNGSVKAWKMRLTGLEAEKVAEMGLHEAILAKLLGVDQEILKEGGLVEAINAGILAKQESTFASVEEALAEDGLNTSICQLIISKNAEVLATNESTVAKERNSVSTAKQKFEEIGFTGVLRSKLVQLRHNILGVNSDTSAKIRNTFTTVEGKKAELGLTTALKLKISALSKNTAEHIKNTASKLREIATNNRLVNGISSLIGRKTAETVATDANTVASNKNLITKIRESVAENGLIGSIKNLIFSRGAETVATDASTASNVGFTAGLWAMISGETIAEGATIGLTGSLGLLKGAFLASPVGWFALAIMGVASAFFVLTGGLDSSWGKMKKFNEMVKDTDSALEPYKEHLKQVKKEHGETSDAYTKAKEDYKEFKKELKESEEVYDKADSYYQTLGTSLNDYSQEILKAQGFSKSFRDEQNAMNNALEIGKDKYQQVYDNMKASTESFKKEYKSMAETLKEAKWDDAGDYLSKFQGNEQSLIEHQYQAETAEDWFGWFWNSLLAGIDKFWIEWDKFWMNVALRFQEDGLVGVLSDAIKWIYDSISPFFSSLWDGLVSMFSDHDWNADIENALKFIGDIPSMIMHFLFGEDKSGTGQAFQDWINGIIPWITNGLNGLGQGILDALNGLGDWCRDHVNQWLIDAPKTIFGDENETWSSLGDKFKEWVVNGLTYLPNKLKELGEAGQKWFEDGDKWISEHITEPFKKWLLDGLEHHKEQLKLDWEKYVGDPIGDFKKFLEDSFNKLGEINLNIAHWVDEHISKPLQDGMKWVGDFLNDPLGTLGIDLGEFNLIDFVLDHIFGEPVSASDGSSHDYHDSLPEILNGIVDDVTQWVMDFPNNLSNAISSVGINIIDFIGSLFGIDNAGEGVMSFLQENIVVPFTEFFTNFISDPIGTLGGLYIDAWNFLGSLFGIDDGGEQVMSFLQERIITPLSTFINNFISDPIGTLGGLGMDYYVFLSSIFGLSDENSVGTWIHDNIVNPIGTALYNGISQIPIVGDFLNLFSLITDENIDASAKGRLIGDLIGRGLTSAIGEIPIVGDIARILGLIPQTNPDANSKGYGVGDNVKQGVAKGKEGTSQSIATEMQNIIGAISKRVQDVYNVAHDVGSQILSGIQEALDMHSPSIISRELIANEFGVYIPDAISSSADTAYSVAHMYGQKIRDGVSSATDTNIGLDSMVGSYQDDAQIIANSSQMMGSTTTTAFNQMQSQVNTTTAQMTGNVTSQYTSMQTKQASLLNNMKTSNTTAYNEMYNKSNQSLLHMRDSTSNVTSQMTDAWKHMKDQIVASANKLKTDSTAHFNTLSTTIGTFYRKIQNPSNWGAGSTNYISKPRRPSTGRRIMSSHFKTGAGYNPYKSSSDTVMTLRELKNTIGGPTSIFDGQDLSRKVNVADYLSMFDGGFGGWNGWNTTHYNHIKSSSDKWNMKAPMILGKYQAGDGFKVGDFENGTPSISFDTFVSTAESIFNAIPYEFYYNSEKWGSWQNAIQHGEANCSDGADALIALAQTMNPNWTVDKVHTNLRSGTGHYYAVINGKVMDTTNFQNHGSWSKLGAGSKPRKYGNSKSVSSDEGKPPITLNLTFNIDGKMDKDNAEEMGEIAGNKVVEMLSRSYATGL